MESKVAFLFGLGNLVFGIGFLVGRARGIIRLLNLHNIVHFNVPGLNTIAFNKLNKTKLNKLNLGA